MTPRAVSSSAFGRMGILPNGPELVEAVARRVVELLHEERLVVGTGSSLVDAAVLAEQLGVSRATVYAHAAELGGVPLGSGPRPRWRFDVEKAFAAWSARSIGGQSQERVRPSAEPKRANRRRRAAGTGAELLPIRERGPC